MLNLQTLKYRNKPTKHQKYKENLDKSSLVNSKKEVIYEYYKCDYCSSEIRLNVKKDERTGGIAILPNSLTKCGNLEVALCNSCLRKVQKQLESN